MLRMSSWYVGVHRGVLGIGFMVTGTSLMINIKLCHYFTENPVFFNEIGEFRPCLFNPLTDIMRE